MKSKHVKVKFSKIDHDLSWRKYRLKRGYPVATTSRKVNGIKKFITIKPHREILSRKLGRMLTPNDISDHVKHNVLDCTRKNIRLTNKSGNSQNRNPNNKFRGTTLHKCGKWQASVDSKYLGLFNERAKAAEVALEHRNKLGYLNSGGAK